LKDEFSKYIEDASKDLKDVNKVITSIKQHYHGQLKMLADLRMQIDEQFESMEKQF